MGGLEEIIRQIGAASESEIAEIMSEAEAECKQITDEGKKETEDMIAAKNRQSETEATLALEKMKSGAGIKKKQEILRIKQKLIAGILDKAQEKMESLDTIEYFEMLLTIIKNNAHEEKGIICFNERDLNRVPKDFVDRLKKMGISLEISEYPVDIQNGVILDYGDIEENCTFQALIDAKREILQDQVNRYIFD